MPTLKPWVAEHFKATDVVRDVVRLSGAIAKEDRRAQDLALSDDAIQCQVTMTKVTTQM